VSRDWTFFLEDILEASNKVLRYTNGMTLETFQSNDLVFDAVVRNLKLSVRLPSTCRRKSTR